MTPEMEALVASLFEKSAIAGGFFYLLYFFVNKFNASLEKIATTMAQVSETLISIDSRMGTLEKRVDKIEGGMGE